MDLNEIKKDKNSDFNKTFQQIVESNGFLFDEYEAVKQDDYVLTMFRIRAPFV